MLDYLMNDQIPDETDPSPQHCDLQRVVNAIRTLGLLSESKISEDWAVAFDSWLDRVLSLESSPRESLFDSVTVAKSLDRNMFTRGDLSRMQLRSAARMISSLVRKTRREYPGMSSPIGSIFYLLGKYSEIKKDVTVHAGKLVQPVLDHLLDNEFSEVVMEGALAVLCIVIDFLPASFLPHYEKAEAVIVSKIVSGQCSSNMMKLKFTSMMSFNAWNKVIISALKAFDVFADDKRNEIMSIRHFLAPERAAYLEARKVQAYAAMHNPHTDALLQHNANEFLFSSGDSSGSSIINSCKESANGEWLFSRTSSKSMEIMQEGYGFIELPALQPCGLDLLSAIIKRTSSQLLPHAGYIIRLLKDCLKQCALTMLRTKLYFIIRTLLISIGIGAALQIAEELTISAVFDLDSSWYLNRQKSATVEAPMQPADRKRKHAAINSRRRGGVLRSDLQPSVDDLLMNVAEITYDGKWRNDEGVKQTRSRNKDCRFCGVALLALEKIMNPRNVSNGDIPKEGIKLNESQIPKSFPADQDESLLSYLRHGYNESEATLSNPEDRKQEAFLVDIEIKRNSDETVNEEQLQGPLSVAEVKPFRRKHE
ncbi:uncharacterized protein LOC120212980 [Hibiscus syriacus]|uniref:uncharacterized protein LOC120212980 n=1 Tax=Hibiscus syriacus TaxID=106335 RepID=UPI0019235C37|nr:uncharacterized protein LOC120212980 [Hibiscus syriacus]